STNEPAQQSESQHPVAKSRALSPTVASGRTTASSRFTSDRPARRLKRLCRCSDPQRLYAIRACEIVDPRPERGPQSGRIGAVISAGHHLVDLARIVDHGLDLALRFHPFVGRIELSP